MMSRTVTVKISAAVYARLEAMAAKEGVEPEMLLERYVRNWMRNHA